MSFSYLTVAEESKLRAVIEAKWSRHLPELDLALHTGLRRSELYGLDWEDVDLARRFIHVRRGKNGHGRHVRLNSVALKALTELQKAGADTGPVIRSRGGDALQAPRHWFEKAIRAAGVENFHWHDLRHTFASRLAMAGVGIRAIQEALGHKSIAMTVRYSHLSPDFLQDAVDKLVPPQPETEVENRTGTEEIAAAEPTTKSVH